MSVFYGLVPAKNTVLFKYNRKIYKKRVDKRAQFSYATLCVRAVIAIPVKPPFLILSGITYVFRFFK